jgi:hypothetical protein
MKELLLEGSVRLLTKIRTTPVISFAKRQGKSGNIVFETIDISKEVNFQEWPV